MKERILNGGLSVFKSKGVKFTMDDLANELGMSKKTIYTIFPDKGTLLYEMVDYAFDLIKVSEKEVYDNPDLDTVEKIRKLMGVLPDIYVGVDFTQLYVLRGKYPKAYARMEERLESGWEATHQLIDKGVAEGKVRDVNRVIFQITFEAAMERFLMRDDLQKNRIAYGDALEELVNLLIDGILVK